MKKLSLIYLLVFFLLSSFAFSKKLKEGTYRAVLTLNEKDNTELPFNFDVKYKGKKPTLIIKNADERIIVNEITIKGDSVNFKMPVFDTEFRCVLNGDTLSGFWINHYKTSNNKIKFSAVCHSNSRFIFSPESKYLFQPNDIGETITDFEGRWETTFSPNTKDSSKAIGVFHHMEQTEFVSGTFLTETGDYRYLEGEQNQQKLYLSCFDGGHAFLFIAEYAKGKITGNFYSGATWVEPWTAKLNPDFKLKDAEEITFLKNKDEKINFSFPDLDKKTISLNDKKFEKKPIIVQIMGSWCPNCMDETAYLSGIYRQYKNEGLEIIALAFEKTNDFEKAKSNLLRLKKKFGMEYDILITQQTGKEKASEVLSALNKITAFPTTIFLNKQHQVIKIHTGFSGPATGADYEVFKQRTENLIKQLLKE